MIEFYCLFVGVKIIEDCHVKVILTEKRRAGQYDRVTRVLTSKGNIKCDIYVNCTGIVKYFVLSLRNTPTFVFHVFSGHENLAFNLHQTFEFLHRHAVRENFT